MASATITSKGQITIPSRVRDALKLKPGDRIEFVEVNNGNFELLPATRSVRDLEGILHNPEKKPVSIEEMNAAIAEGAAESA